MKKSKYMAFGDWESDSKIDPVEVLKEAKKLDFTNKESCEEFNHKYKAYFEKRSSLILHDLAKDKTWTYANIKKFLKWLQDKCPNNTLLESRIAESQYIPFHTALRSKNDDFVLAVLDMVSEERPKGTPGQQRGIGIEKAKPAAKTKLEMVLDAKTNGKENCLHLAILSKSRLMNRIIKECKSCPEMFTDKDNDGDTPLHVAVGSFDPEIVDLKINHQSNIPHHVVDQYNRRPSVQLLSSSYAASEVSATNGLYNESLSSKFSLYNTMLILLKYGKDAVFEINDSKNTPYQLRLENLKDRLVEAQPNRPRNVSFYKALREAEIEDSVASHIRLYCIQHLSRKELMKALYKPGEGKPPQIPEFPSD
jgi:hypothetical protein